VTIPADCVFALRANTIVGPLAQISVTPTNAALLPRATLQFTATGSDALGALLNPQPAFAWSVNGDGTIDSNGLFTAGAALGGPFEVTASSGSVTGTALISITDNLAVSGTGYTWYGLVAPTDSFPQAPSPRLNDSDLDTDAPLFPGGGSDNPNAYEAAGLVWSNPLAVGQVLYHNGAYDYKADGVFAAAFGLQFSSDGVTWSNAGPEWALSPSYPYDSPASGDTTFTFTGGVATAMGVRCVGQVHTRPTGSWVAFATEVQAFPPPLPAPFLTITSNSNGVAVSWPGVLTNYAVESTTSLAAGSPWTPVTNPPQSNGPQQTIILQPASGPQFFRLHLQ
jgi:hypothetical protein